MRKMGSSQGNKRPEIAVIGGGISGLCTVISLRQRLPETSITLVDKRDFHLKIPRIHELLRASAPKIKIPFKEIEESYQIRFIQAEVQLPHDAIPEIASTRTLELPDQSLEFDYLVIAGGLSDPIEKQPHPGCVSLGDFLEGQAESLLLPSASTHRTGKDNVTIIGAGPTGVQFAFELKDYFERIGEERHIHIVDSGAQPLARFAPCIGEYILRKMQARGINHLPQHQLVSSEPGRLILKDASGIQQNFHSGVTICLTGARPSTPFRVNLFGQVLFNERPCPRIFAAGDLAFFKGPIPMTTSAQSAIRKGKLVAKNIVASEKKWNFSSPYLHADRGYIVSLGDQDAVGWVGSRRRMVKGSIALSLRQLIDKQYDLLLDGIDTFIV